MKKPVQPIVTATAEDGEITLVWDDVAREFDIQPFLDNEINFEGYKIYKATDIEMKDAKIVTDGYGTPIKYRPVAQYDLVNGISQYIKYGADRGSGYFLGSDVGIKNYFIDTSVKNGVKYYYFVTAYNTGTYKIGNGIAPQESDFNSVTGDFSPNVVAVTPRVQSLGFENADIEILDWNTFGNGFVQPEVFIDANIKPGHTYKAIFESEEGPGGGVASYGPKASIFRTDGLKIYDITDVTDDSSSGTLVYYENNKKYNEKNFYFDRYDAGFWNHTPDGWVVLDTGEILETATFDGLKLKFGVAHQTAKINHYATGWKTGTAPHNLELQTTWDKQFMAFDYDIVFTGNDSEYTSKSNNTTVYDFENKKINNILFGQSYNFYVLNWSILDSLGNPDTADVVTWDKDGNGEFDPLVDAYLIGHTTFFKRGGWKFNSTLLAAILDFNTATSVEELPETGDVFTIRWIRPFFDGDYITFKVNGYKNEQENLIENNLDKIRVVPNPYIFTNSGEENSDIANYERRMMFNNLPENCTIKIYTITGMLIKELRVTPESKSSMSEGQVLDIGNGIAYWDLTNRKGRQVAPGYYIYRVKSDLTGETYMDKFAIIK